MPECVFYTFPLLPGGNMCIIFLLSLLAEYFSLGAVNLLTPPLSKSSWSDVFYKISILHLRHGPTFSMILFLFVCSFSTFCESLYIPALLLFSSHFPGSSFRRYDFSFHALWFFVRLRYQSAWYKGRRSGTEILQVLAYICQVNSAKEKCWAIWERLPSLSIFATRVDSK